jgi:hypothetical protein
MYTSGSLEGISVKTVARDGNYQIFLLNFRWTFYNRTTATFNYVNDLMFNLSVYCN